MCRWRRVLTHRLQFGWIGADSILGDQITQVADFTLSKATFIQLQEEAGVCEPAEDLVQSLQEWRSLSTTG